MDHNHKIIQQLTHFDFTEKEASVYLHLIQIGSSLPSIIARKTGIKRPTVYMLLENLQKKGLVSFVIKNGTRYFDAVEPKILLKNEEKRFDKLKNLLPELEQLKDRYDITPQMAIFEGTEGVIQIMEDTLNADGEILCWSAGNLAFNNEKFKEYHNKHYSQKKQSKDIWIRGIFQYDQVGVEFKRKASEQLREVYLVPDNKFPFENEINIYNDKLSIISHKDQIGVIIQNQAIANTQRAIFKFAFEYAKMLEPQILSDEHKKEFYPDM